LTEKLAVLEKNSQETTKIRQDNVILTRKYKDLKSECEEYKKELNGIQEEFSVRLDKEEQKFIQIKKERDALKYKLSDNSEKLKYEKELKDKEKEYNELLEEGNKLSKKILQMEELSKKIRTKLTESDQKVSELTTSNSNLTNQLKEKQIQIEHHISTEKQQSVLIQDASAVQIEFENLKKENTKLKLEGERLKNENIELNSKMMNIQTQYSSEEKEKYQNSIKKFETEKEEYEKVIQTLEKLIISNKKEYESKMNDLRIEIEQFISKYAQSESKNEELVTQVPTFTKPLLEQISILESASIAKENNWKQEKVNLENQLKISENNLKLITRDRNKYETSFMDAKKSIILKDELIGNLNEKVEIFGKENEKLKSELSDKSTLYFNTLEKYNNLNQEFDELSKKFEKLQEERNTLQSKLLNKLEQPTSPVYELPPSPKYNKNEVKNGNIYQLEEKVRQFQSQIQSLLKQNSELEQVKIQLSEELINCNTKYMKIENELKQFSQERQDYQTLKKRHTAALEIIGEKEETISEMQQEFNEVKDMFRRQIDQLLKK
jgi:TATA element modulatory factor